MLSLRRLSCVAAAGLLIGGPTVLAFFQGAFFTEPRLVAAIVAWLLVLLTALAAERPLPRHLPGRLAIGGLVLLTGWTALSLAWAPLGDAALNDLHRLALYSAILIASAAWLGSGPVARVVEPGLLLGVAVVVGYGMSERFLPGVVELARSPLAFGRLQQPVTYWNGMGLLAAMGLVLSARLAGSADRPRALRAAAAATAPLLGAGLILTLSRGSLLAGAAGMVALLLLGPERAQPRSVALTVVVAGLAAALGALLPGVDEVGAGASSSSGAALLAATVVLAAGAAILQLRLVASRGDAAGRAAESTRRLRFAVAMAVAVALAVVAATIDPGQTGQPEGTETRSAQRLGSLESERYRYWDVALDAFAEHPLNGTGAGGFRVEWARAGAQWGPARDAHSLYLETAAELGLVGLALLGIWLAGLIMSARRGLAANLGTNLGLAAVALTWTFHAGIDWNWEVPAVTLPALVAAGALVGAGDRAVDGLPAGASASGRPAGEARAP